MNLIQALLRILSEYYFHKKSSSVDLLRGRDSNPRPLGYEPNELPLLLPRDIILKNFYIVVFIYIQIYGKNSKIQNIFFVEMTGVEPVSKNGMNKPHSQA